MYLPNRELAQVPEKKLREYLLSMSQPAGHAWVAWTIGLFSRPTRVSFRRGSFLREFSIWLSATAPDSRRASARAFLCSIAWFLGPFFVTHLFPCLGVRLPGWGLCCEKRMASGQ